jgi:hypothetical protein
VTTNDGDISQPLIPVDQQTLTFYGKPLVVVRLTDGRAGAVLRWFCENLELDPSAQVRRIQRTEELADDLVYVQVQTVSGVQVMPTLILHAVPAWLASIDSKRVRAEVRPEIRRYKREVVDLLYAWASRPRTGATGLVPSEPVVAPTRPAQDAPLEDWHEYHLQMAALIEWRMDVERWRGSVETRLEGLEAVTDLIPEILERLGPATLTPAHQSQLQQLVKRLHQVSKKPYPTIYEDLKLAFSVPRYQDLLEGGLGAGGAMVPGADRASQAIAAIDHSLSETRRGDELLME